MANTFKKVIDRMMWDQVAPAPNAHASGACLASDLRSDVSRNPFVYQLVSATVLNRFNFITKAWAFVQSPALTGTFGAGAAIGFAPSLGYVGTIAASPTPTSTRVALSIASPALQAVGLNMLANRGGSGDYGYKIRIIDNASGGSGKTEERYIVGNTAGTTPTVDVLSAFTFTPTVGARYEIVAGRVFMLSSGLLAANAWRSLEVASNFLSTTLPVAGIPGTLTTDSSLLVLDEQYTPFDMVPGEGMIKGAFVYDTGVVSRSALTATGMGASSLTGQATLGDSVVLANEYRNFQIRIVQDLTNTTAVGQRRIIASHTAGASPVYTLGTAWSVQPSATAKYVIELPNLMLLRTTANTTVYTYNYTDATINNGTNSITTNTWSATYFSAVAPAAGAVGGQWMPSWGIHPDVNRNARHSFNYFWRGGSSTLDVFDIAGSSITGTWTSAVVYDGAQTIGTGTSGTYAPTTNDGRMFYMNIYAASAINQIYRFDVENRVLSPYTPTDFIQSGTAVVGNRMASYVAIDGTDLYDVILLQSHTSTISQELIPLV